MPSWMSCSRTNLLTRSQSPMAAGPRNARRKRLSAPATADGRGLNRVLLSEGASLASSPIAPSAVVGVINAFCASLSSGTRSAIAVVGVSLLDLQRFTSCRCRLGSMRSPLSGGGTGCTPLGTWLPLSSISNRPCLTSAGVAVICTRTEQAWCHFACSCTWSSPVLRNTPVRSW